MVVGALFALVGSPCPTIVPVSLEKTFGALHVWSPGYLQKRGDAHFLPHDSLIKEDLILQTPPVKIPVTAMLGIFHWLFSLTFRHSKRYQHREHGFYGKLKSTLSCLQLLKSSLSMCVFHFLKIDLAVSESPYLDLQEFVEKT